jgi:hypothetical protein
VAVDKVLLADRAAVSRVLAVVVIAAEAAVNRVLAAVVGAVIAAGVAEAAIKVVPAEALSDPVVTNQSFEGFRRIFCTRFHKRVRNFPAKT